MATDARWNTRHYLYGDDAAYRLKREIILEIGGMRLLRADEIADDVIWTMHTEAKGALIDMANERCGVTLHPKVPILGFARRMTGYNRPDLLFSDVDRLKRIAEQWPFQMVLAGKTHPKDESGKQLIEKLHGFMHRLKGNIPVVFLPNYDMTLARTIVAGADVWLNTPQRPLEASGTSSMKAACNGVPSLGVLDGWWIEGCIEGITGWVVGGDNSKNRRWRNARVAGCRPCSGSRLSGHRNRAPDRYRWVNPGLNVISIRPARTALHAGCALHQRPDPET